MSLQVEPVRESPLTWSVASVSKLSGVPVPACVREGRGTPLTHRNRCLFFAISDLGGSWVPWPLPGRPQVQLF